LSDGERCPRPRCRRFTTGLRLKLKNSELITPSGDPHCQGLGKTLQASCIMGAAVIDQAEAYRAAAASLQSRTSPSPSPSSDPAACPAAAAAAPFPQPCLVVCPSTLVAHWAHEVGRYVSREVLRPLQYQGTPGERLRTQVRVDVTWARQRHGTWAKLSPGRGDACVQVRG